MKSTQPVQPLRCTNSDCTLSEGGRCARISEFTHPLDACPDLVREEQSTQSRAAKPTPSTQEVSETSAPWSGRHLDTAEAERLLLRTPARVISILGPYNAGKTCLLTSFFLQLANGQRGAFPYRFASSLTLHGFRELSERAEQWTGQREEDIVQHTSVGADALRPRNFLHLGLRPEREEDDRHIDVLLTDIPGEWVKAWTGQVDDASRRQMSFTSRSDAFFVLVDAEALMGPSGNRADSETSLLIRRIEEMSRGMEPRPPLALVLSKFDRVASAVLPPPPEKSTEREAWGALSSRLRRTWIALDEAKRAGVPFELFPVSAFPHQMTHGQPIGVMAPFTYAMKYADRRIRGRSIGIPIPEGARGFATMRFWRDEP